MAKDKVTETSSEETKVSVVVLKGKLLRHDGGEYRQNSRLDLPEDDANRLISLGFVKAYTVLLLESQQVSEPEVSVSGSEIQPSSDAVNPIPDSGAV